MFASDRPEYTGHIRVTSLDGSDKDSWYPFICGHCHTQVSGAVVAVPRRSSGEVQRIKWLWCPVCADASVLSHDGIIYPGEAFGPPIEGLPKEVSVAYDEARSCMLVNAFTAAELMCRKILMHIAVERDALEGASFENYLAHPRQSGYITPPMQAWTDLIRKHGNKATHRLESTNRKRAASTSMFTAELLRIIYEMDHLARQYAPQQTSS